MSCCHASVPTGAVELGTKFGCSDLVPRLVALVMLCAICSACGGSESAECHGSHTLETISVQSAAADPSGISLTMRADAVCSGASVDVTIAVDDIEQKFSNVAPGTTFDLGTVAPATRARLEVINVGDAGAVRAHVLTSNCFRSSAMCGGDGCIARAAYVVVAEDCVNF
jgi:hypothetical protein